MEKEKKGKKLCLYTFECFDSDAKKADKRLNRTALLIHVSTPANKVGPSRREAKPEKEERITDHARPPPAPNGLYSETLRISARVDGWSQGGIGQAYDVPPTSYRAALTPTVANRRRPKVFFFLITAESAGSSPLSVAPDVHMTEAKKAKNNTHRAEPG